MPKKIKHTDTPQDKINAEKAEKAAKAIVVVHVNVWDALDKVVKDLSPADSRFVTEQVSGIQSDLKVVMEKHDAIAARLAAIHAKVGKEMFASLATNIFPRFGMSRSTVYRLKDSAEVLKAVLPNPKVRQTLIGRFERPLTTTNQTTGEVVLTPAFVKALKKVPSPVKASGDGKTTIADDSPEAIDAYTAALIAETRKLGKPKAKSATVRKTEAIDRLSEMFQGFMKQWGTDEAAKLLTDLRTILTTEQQTIEAAPESKPKPAPVSKTA